MTSNPITKHTISSFHHQIYQTYPMPSFTTQCNLPECQRDLLRIFKKTKHFNKSESFHGNPSDPASAAATQASKEEVDSRSIFVGNGHSYS